jgi:hypothetical protein
MARALTISEAMSATCLWTARFEFTDKSSIRIEGNDSKDVAILIR